MCTNNTQCCSSLVLPDTWRDSAHSELNFSQYILSCTLRRWEWTIYLGSENNRSQLWRDLLWEKTTSSLKLSKTNQSRLRDKKIFETIWKSKDHPITGFSVYLLPTSILRDLENFSRRYLRDLKNADLEDPVFIYWHFNKAINAKAKCSLALRDFDGEGDA